MMSRDVQAAQQLPRKHSRATSSETKFPDKFANFLQRNIDLAHNRPHVHTQLGLSLGASGTSMMLPI